jgi:hypothetical protein
VCPCCKSRMWHVMYIICSLSRPLTVVRFLGFGVLCKYSYDSCIIFVLSKLCVLGILAKNYYRFGVTFMVWFILNLLPQYWFAGIFKQLKWRYVLHCFVLVSCLFLELRFMSRIHQIVQFGHSTQLTSSDIVVKVYSTEVLLKVWMTAVAC